MEVVDKGTYYQCKFLRMHFFELWHGAPGLQTDKARFILQKVLDMVPDTENVDFGKLRDRLQYLSKQLTAYWKKVNRDHSVIRTRYCEWLNVLETIDMSKSAAASTSHHEASSLPLLEQESNISSKMGRPKKDFGECSKRTQRQRLTELSKMDDSTVSSLLETSSERVKCEVNVDEVLSLITEAKLTKHQYLLIKELINSKDSPVLPSYNKVLEAKKRCYPEEQTITEKSAEVELQSLLNHTATRILDSQSSVLASIPQETLGDVILIGKWGFDGSTGHSEYKQCFSEAPDMNDGSLFLTSYVPLRLVSVVATTGEQITLWKNPRPSSTKYCRPIRFQFAKETKELAKNEESYFNEKINNLLPTSYTFQDEEIKVYHELQLTMVDGKICNALSDISSASRCYLCKATPKEMNSIDVCLNKEIDVTKLDFGLSPLHSWIRFFEYFLHLSYRLDVKKWQVRSSEEKELVDNKKRTIQNEFKRKLGLIVDKPRSGGSGTSNDGNTARRFFGNSALSAEITGIDKNLIDRCGTILNCLNSGYNINSDRFKEFALETARQLVKEYPWYNLPASVHKILIHGSEVINHAMVSIGELSEEAAESTNKNIKAFRLNHTRKMSRVLTNTDLLNRLLLNSDPFITGLRKLPRKKKSVLSKAVISLLDF